MTGSKNGFYTASAGKLLAYKDKKVLEKGSYRPGQKRGLRKLRKRHGIGNEVDRDFNSRFEGFEKRIWD